MFCPSCGVESTNKTKYCKSCGANLGTTGNTVEVKIPKPPVAAMTFAIAAFAVFGLIASMILLGGLSTSGSNLDEKHILLAFIASLGFVSLVTIGLTTQLGRLIGSYRDAVKQTIQREQVEPISAPRLVVPPQPLSIPSAQEPISSVTEHTTRTFAPSLETGPGSK